MDLGSDEGLECLALPTLHVQHSSQPSPKSDSSVPEDLAHTKTNSTSEDWQPTVTVG